MHGNYCQFVEGQLCIFNDRGYFSELVFYLLGGTEENIEKISAINSQSYGRYLVEMVYPKTNQETNFQVKQIVQ